MQQFVAEHAELFATLAVASAVMFVGSLLAVPWLLSRMPADYFVRERPHRADDGSRWWLWLARKLAKNLIGGLLLFAGIAMLALPGQGLLTLLAGVVLIDYPGKRALELKLVSRPRILHAINWLRARRGRPPLVVDRDALPATAHADASLASDGNPQN